MTFSTDNPEGVATYPLWKICLGKTLRITRVKCYTMAPSEVSGIATKCGAPEQDVKVAPTECVARAITCGVQGLVLGPLVEFRGTEPPEALRF